MGIERTILIIVVFIASIIGVATIQIKRQFPDMTWTDALLTVIAGIFRDREE